MALRYSVKLYDESLKPKTELRVAPKAREPVQVAFRKGADYSNAISTIMTNSQVQLSAAVGSGKSTSFPRALAKTLRGVLMYVVANPLLVTHIYDYVTTSENFISDGVHSHLYQYGDDFDFSERKPLVIYISSSQLVAKLISMGEMPLKGVSVYLDEAHEADAYSYILRHLSLAMGAERVITASATFSPAEFRRRETDAKVETIEYDPDETADTWDISDPKKPWYYAQHHNIVVYIDSISVGDALESKYKYYGCEVFRLNSRTTVKEFRRAMLTMRDERKLTVLIADYTFRSGFTFEANTVLDTGIVYFMSGKPGHVQKGSRSIYAFEAEQAAGRVGRIPGIDAVYARPAGPLVQIRNDLEGVEIEAAALLCRVLGFFPLPSLSKTIMGEYDLPPDVGLGDALNGLYPLTYYVKDNPHRAVKVDIASKGKSVEATVVNTAKVTAKIEKHEEFDNPVDINGKQITDTWAHQLADLDVLTLDDFKSGVYCYFENVPSFLANVKSNLFPDGVTSVLAYIDRQVDTVTAYTQLAPADKHFLLSAVVQQYNSMCVEYEAMQNALTVSADTTGFKLDSSVAKTLAKDFIAKVNIVRSMRDNLFDKIVNLVTLGLRLKSFQGLPRVLAQRVSLHVRDFSRDMRSATTCKVGEYTSNFVFDESLANKLPASKALSSITLPVVPAFDGLSFSVRTTLTNDTRSKRLLKSKEEQEPERFLPPEGFDPLKVLQGRTYAKPFDTHGDLDSEVTEYGTIRYYPETNRWTGIGPPIGMFGHIPDPWCLPKGHRIRLKAEALYPQLVPT